MKRILFLLAALACAGALAWMFGQAAAPGRPIARLFPPGATLYLEAGDFRSLWKDWNGSQPKRLWLASDNYQAFSRSNLFLKLQAAQNEFAAAAGVPPNVELLESVAGGESALAIYDIGELQFLYVTRMPSAQFAGSALWKARGAYQTRRAAGLDYYVHVDRASKRLAAFAAANDYLILGTHEEAVAGAVALVAGEASANLSDETWYRKSIEAAKQPGELRLVLNMERLLQSPYMRSYWIQRNASELKQYDAAIADTRRTSGAIEESRILFRREEQNTAWNEAAVAQLTRLVPDNAGLYRAWASPTREEAYDLLRRKVFAPGKAAVRNEKTAPVSGSMDASAGAEADLEVRIDEPPLETGAAQTSEVPGLLEANKLGAMMQVERTRVLPDGSFVGIDSAVVLLGESDWSKTLDRDSGPLPGINISTSGKILVATNRAELGAEILRRAGLAPLEPARYAARYGHARELPNFIRLTRLIDTPLKADTPPFFSANVASLGRTLGWLDAASITVHDTGGTVWQHVVYRAKP